MIQLMSASSLFQSTLPAGGATRRRRFPCKPSTISIHAPRRGSDMLSGEGAHDQQNFNPRSPQGERQYHSLQEND